MFVPYMSFDVRINNKNLFKLNWIVCPYARGLFLVITKYTSWSGYGKIQGQIGPGCSHVTCDIVLYLILIYYFFAKWVISHMHTSNLYMVLFTIILILIWSFWHSPFGHFDTHIMVILALSFCSFWYSHFDHFGHLDTHISANGPSPLICM